MPAPAVYPAGLAYSATGSPAAAPQMGGFDAGPGGAAPIFARGPMGMPVGASPPHAGSPRGAGAPAPVAASPPRAGGVVPLGSDPAYHAEVHGGMAGPPADGGIIPPTTLAGLGGGHPLRAPPPPYPPHP